MRVTVSLKKNQKKNPKKPPETKSLVINWYKSSVWATGMDYELQWGILAIL